MAKLKIPNDWWTAPAQADNGNLLMVTGRSNLHHVKNTGFYNSRIEVMWKYESDTSGMPSLETSKLMEQAHDALCEAFDKDPVAVLVGIYTGDGERDWVFYTRSLHIFQRKLNEALATLPPLPLSFYAEDDPEWEEYNQILQTEIIPEED